MCQNQEIERLRAISQHCIRNAWYKVRFNLGNERGIHGATPSEMLHAILLGMFKCTRDIIFEMVGKDFEIVIRVCFGMLQPGLEEFQVITRESVSTEIDRVRGGVTVVAIQTIQNDYFPGRFQ